MSTGARLEQWVVIAGVFLANFLDLRHPAFNFTYSDVLFCVSLVLLIMGGKLPKSPWHSMTTVWYLFFCLFLGAMILSSIVSGDPLRALAIIVQYTFAYLVLPFILMGRGPQTSIQLLRVFVSSMVAVCLIGLWFLYFTETKEILGHALISGSNRLASTLGNANALAAMIALTFPVVLYLMVTHELSIFLALPTVIVLGTALVATSSVSGLATSLLGVVTFLLCSGSLGGWRRIAGGLSAAAVLAALFMWWGGGQLPPTFERRVLEPLRTGNLDDLGTYSARMHLMEEAIERLDDTLLLGMGADQFRSESEFEAPVHNVYLLLWVESGLPALIGWLGLFATAFALAGRAVLTPATRHAGALGLSIALLFCVVAFNSAHMYARFRVVPLFLAMGVVLAVSEQDQRRRAELIDRPAEPAPARA
jgi:O-antigen ligase